MNTVELLHNLCRWTFYTLENLTAASCFTLLGFVTDPLLIQQVITGEQDSSTSRHHRVIIYSGFFFKAYNIFTRKNLCSATATLMLTCAGGCQLKKIIINPLPWTTKKPRERATGKEHVMLESEKFCVPGGRRQLKTWTEKCYFVRWGLLPKLRWKVAIWKLESRKRKR